MKYLLFTDNHFCEFASILTKYGKNYSLRIENQLQSLNWLEDLAVHEQCDAVICLGDFFDKPSLNDNEITAVQEIKWNSLPHLFIVGNHESDEAVDAGRSSTMVLKDFNREIISNAVVYPTKDCELCFLPYIIERDRRSLEDYFGPKPIDKKRIILSHNDLKGIQMGAVVSKTGFEIKDIQANCDLFINGHLHNGQKVADKVINLGNLTGKDFGEDAARYKHNIMILDTETCTYKLIENPYAFKFYKLVINNQAELNLLSTLSENSVITVKCLGALVPAVQKAIDVNKNIIAHRIITLTLDTDTAEKELTDLTITDPVSEFVNYMRSVSGTSDALEAELAEICK